MLCLVSYLTYWSSNSRQYDGYCLPTVIWIVHKLKDACLIIAAPLQGYCVVGVVLLEGYNTLPSMQSTQFSASTIPLGQAHEYPPTPTELSRQRWLQFPLFNVHGLLEAVCVCDAILLCISSGNVYIQLCSYPRYICNILHMLQSIVIVLLCNNNIILRLMVLISIRKVAWTSSLRN